MSHFGSADAGDRREAKLTNDRLRGEEEVRIELSSRDAVHAVGIYLEAGQQDGPSLPGPNFVRRTNEFVIYRILAVFESSRMSASWGKGEEGIFPFRGGELGGAKRSEARYGRTGALAQW